MPGEARQLRRGLARAEATLLALEALKEKAREEQDRRRKKDLEKERKRLEKDLERQEREQENLRRADEFIAQRRAAEGAARVATAAAANTAATPRTTAANPAAPQPTRKEPLPTSASLPGGATSSATSMVSLLQSAAQKTVDAFVKEDKTFATTLAPLLTIESGACIYGD